MVEMSDHVLPISTADMWSLWVGRCMHTLVTCIAQPKGNPVTPRPTDSTREVRNLSDET